MTLTFIVRHQVIKKDLSINDFGNRIVCTINSIPKVNNDSVSFSCKNEAGTILLTTKVMDLKIGNVIAITDSLEKAKNNTIPNLFNYAEYLLSKGIFYTVYTDKVKVISADMSINFLIINKIISYYEVYPGSDFVLSFLIGNKNSLSEDFLDKTEFLNISHLFVVSGFHVMFIYALFSLLFKHLHVSSETTKVIICFILILFLVLNNFALSVMRAVVFLILLNIKDHFKIKISNFEILCLITVIFLFVNPLLYFDAGFILSYLLTIVLLLGGKIITGKFSFFKINIYAQIFSLPIVANFTFYYNFLSFAFTPILTLYYTFVLFPVIILLIIIPQAGIIVKFPISFYDNILSFLSNFSMLNINIGSFTTIRTIIYYLLIYLIMVGIEKKKRFLVKSVVVFVIVFYYHKLSLVEEVTFFDVNQGDSAFIRSESCNALIDIGGSSSNSHPGERVQKYLKSIQIDKIDVFFISHTDYDHAKDYQFILNYFKVDTIVFSAYDKSELHDEIIEESKFINIVYATAYNKVECGNLIFNIINPLEENNTINDNSLVFFLLFNGDSYLFTGDISSVVEEEIIEHFSLDIDFLKVSHHGSKNSTSDLFLEKTKPLYAVISVGTNYYSHPSIDCLNRLKSYNVQTYRTDNDGSVQIKYFLKKRRMIITFKPHNNDG